MSNILLVTVTKVEAAAVLSLFEKTLGYKPETQNIKGEIYYKLGIINGQKIFMARSEMGATGPGGSVITIRDAIENLHVSAVIMTGIAFGVKPTRQKLGDILVSRQLALYELQRISEDGVTPRGDRVTASEDLLKQFENGSLDWKGPQVHFGLILSGEKLIASQAFRDELLKIEPTAIGGEMEGAGLYSAARKANVQWILVKAICDWGDSNKSDDHQLIAAQNAAEFVLHVLLQAPKSSNGLPPFSQILQDYEKTIDSFFDPDSGAVWELGRDDGSPKFLYTELTGYAIKDFLFMYSLTGNGEYLKKARRSAEWIKKEAVDPCGGVKTRYYFEKDDHPENPNLAELSFTSRRIYSFDTAICLSGLLELFKVTQDDSYLQLCIVLGDFLVSCLRNESGEVAAIYDAVSGTKMPDQPKWSRQSGAFHSKVAEALLGLYSVTQNQDYQEKAILICKKALEFQLQDGNFVTSADKTELHPHCYAAEGLLYVGQNIQDKELAREFIHAARYALEWALNRSQNGEIPQVVPARSGTHDTQVRFRTDALAQTLALAADLFMIGELDQKHLLKARELAVKLLDMKSPSDKYFRYGFYEEEVEGKLESGTRSYWTNMFCLRGLYKYFLAATLAKTDLLILAGGKGSRCWPISSETNPKHLSLNLLGDRSLLQETFNRYTYRNLIQPRQIYILCSEAGNKPTWEQARGNNIPHENIIVEQSPDGTTPAVWKILNRLEQNDDRDSDRMLIVSMADDVIEPYEAFQHALISALFIATENECMVSVGKPIDKNQAHDNRFGYMSYSRQLSPYWCHEVNFFTEKPEYSAFETLIQAADHIAWEGGTVVVSESYFRKAAQEYQNEGSLAEDLLSRAGPWLSSKANQLKVAVSLLDARIRFEDFGVPGQNLHRFFRGNQQFDFGSDNVCLGNPGIIEMLYCSNNLIISDHLPMKLYGLHGYLVIDNSWTNTTVFMPLKDADKLPSLYRLLQEPNDLKPFITGGVQASRTSKKLAWDCTEVTLASTNGLLFAYNCNEKIWAKREAGSISILSQDLPDIKLEDYENLYQKQLQDPKLTDHLVHVAALAKYFHEDAINLSRPAQDMLTLLCLYHNFGGYLSDLKEKQEAEVVSDFKKVSKLERKHLDTRVINELLASYPNVPSFQNNELIDLMNDSVNSAVQFLRHRKVESTDLRDIVLFLIQIQDASDLFAGFRNNMGQKFEFSVEEIERVYASFKIADHFSNGRWLWKRNKYDTNANTSYQGFLRFDKGPIEDFPFTVSFTIDWFQKAQIKPDIYINRLNSILSNPDSRFRSLLETLEDGAASLTADLIYSYLLKNQGTINRIEIESLIHTGINNALTDDSQLFQLFQILELPYRLRNIAFNSTGIDRDTVNLVAESIKNAYHTNEVNRQRIYELAEDSIDHLLKWKNIS